jgi:hypothetical protein
VHDFSAGDRQQAEWLLNVQKLKMQMATLMSKSHDEIEMFEGAVGTRAIRDSRH